MKSITVHFWGYKSKNLPEAVETLISNQSGKNSISVHVYDQTNLNRSNRFNISSYNYVPWDTIKSPFKYLNQSLVNSKTDYFMYIEGAKFFEKNWDLELVMSNNDQNIVISGNNAIEFNDEYKFYPSYKKIKTDKALFTHWIDQEFIFMSTKLFKNFPDVSSLKYLGLADVYSLYCAYNQISIQCIPSAWIKKTDDVIHNSDYIPFSIKHKYNTVIDIYQKNKNIYFEDTNSSELLKSLTGFSFDQLNYLPYTQDDIGYSLEMDIDSLGEEKFSQKIQKIG
jgi:hypothetical protein